MNWHTRWIPSIAGLACCLGLLASVGCTTFAPGTPERDHAAKPDLPTNDSGAFEQKRNEAQYRAARDRAEQGDVPAAEKLLQTLLERNPEHLDAQLLLADLYVAQDRTAEAERRLRAILKTWPEEARVHHSLGLLYDVTNRSPEALKHFRRAAELAPDEPTYRLSLQASSPDSPGAQPD